ncbi:MAG: glycosyltransferase [Bacteroidota bacterium]
MGLIIFIYCGLAILLSFFYGYLIIFFNRGWDRQKPWPLAASPFQTSVSIIIPARNEENNILSCLGAVLAQKYPPHLLEIIIVDDHSTDTTAELIENHPSSVPKLIKMADLPKQETVNAHKKKALETGIKVAKGDLIVTTDADCVMGEYWIATIVSGYEAHQYKIIAAPVIFHHAQSIFEKFQSLDFLGMMGVTGAGIETQSIHMANGANLAFEKQAFEAIDGYGGIDQIASGDDMMLMQKMAKAFPGKIGFVNDPQGATYTKPEPSLTTFFRQRIRWATKTGSYNDQKITYTWAMVWMYCLCILSGFVLSLIFGWPAFFIFMFTLITKSWFDYQFLGRTARFFQRRDLVKPLIFLPSIFLEIIYVVVIGLLGLVIKEYEWKGRKVK